MVTVGLFVRLEAQTGKEAAVEAFLRGGLALAESEPATTAWFALRMGPSTFGIFDAFPDESGREAHLTGPIAAALMAQAAARRRHVCRGRGATASLGLEVRDPAAYMFASYVATSSASNIFNAGTPFHYQH